MEPVWLKDEHVLFGGRAYCLGRMSLRNVLRNQHAMLQYLIEIVKNCSDTFFWRQQTTLDREKEVALVAESLLLNQRCGSRIHCTAINDTPLITAPATKGMR